jgi:hypothetical protein
LLSVQADIEKGKHVLELKGADLAVAAANLDKKHTEIKAAGQVHQANVKSAHADIKGAATDAKDELAGLKNDAADAKLNGPAPGDQLDTIVEKLVGGLEKIAQMQIEVANQQREASDANMKALAESISRPKTSTAKKGPDGKWMIESK